MKRSLFIIALLCCTLAVPSLLAAEEGAASKIVAIGDVDVGSGPSGQGASDLKETIQFGLKKQLEKLGKGQYSVNIVSPTAASPAAAMPSLPTDLPELPADRAPTPKEISQYMNAMQQWQQQMPGKAKPHTPVSADAYFEFRVVSGQSGVDTGGTAGLIGDLAGINTHVGDISTKTTRVHLIATMRDPKTGSLIDKHTAAASSVKFRNVAGYTSYDYGSDEMTRERLFSSAIKSCAKWIDGKIK